MTQSMSDLEKTALIFEPIKPYFKYSEELKIVAPVVSYSCSLYAIQKGLQLFKTHKAIMSEKLQSTVQNVLVAKLTEVEKIRESEVGRSEEFQHKDEIVKEFLSAVFVRCIA